MTTTAKPTPKKPLPTVSDFNRPFWQAAHKGELRLQRCDECNFLWAPNGPVCPNCLSEKFQWEKLSGRGKIASWVVFHRLYIPAFADELPYNVAFVELDEGPRLIANIVSVDNADLKIGMPVEVVFEKVTDEISIPKFKPAKS
jgi:hypothetical protein